MQEVLVFGVSVVAEQVSEEGTGALATSDRLMAELLPAMETVTETV